METPGVLDTSPFRSSALAASAKYGFSTVTGTVSSCTEDPEMLAVTTTASNTSACGVNTTRPPKLAIRLHDSVTVS